MDARPRALARRWTGLLAAVLMAGTGCAVGYTVTRPEATPDVRRPADWSSLSFAVSGTATERYAAFRALRGRYGVVDVRTNAGPPAAWRLAFTTGTGKEEGPSTLAIASFLSFSIIPGTILERTDVILTLTAPDGATFQAQGAVSMRMVSWLPLALLGPTYLGSVNGAISAREYEGADATETVVGRLLVEAEPFVELHRGQPRGRP